MPNRVLETVLTGRNLLSPMLAAASRDVVAFNAEMAGANVKASTSAVAAANVQDGAAAKIAASNVKASTSAQASATVQSRAHAKAAESATLNARVQESANNALARSNGLLGTSLTPLTAGLGATALALGYAGYRGMEFDSAMSQVQAASQASAKDMHDLRDAAVDAGAKTQYSAVEAAQGITEMSKAGVQAKDILGGGLTGALNLAAAGQISVAEAAETGATALSVFNLRGDQMSHVADLLAAGAGKAQGSVGDLSAALNQSALVANQTGLSIEDTAGALAMFASNGLIGSDAGTSFKAMLQALTPNSVAASKAMDAIGFSAYDAQGSFVGMESVAAQLRTGLAGLTEEQRNTTLETIFGSDAVRAASVLYSEGAAGVAEWTGKVDDAGYAQKQAAQLTDNLRGDLERLGGAFDSVMTTIGGGAQGALREAVQALTFLVNVGGDVIGFFTSLPGPIQAGIVALGAFHLLSGPISTGIKSIGFAIDVMTASMANSAGPMSMLKSSAGGLLGIFGGPWGLAITGAAVGLSMLVSWLGSSSDSSDGAAVSANNLTSALQATKGAIDDTVRAAAAADLEDAGLLKWADEWGIKSSDLVDAATGVDGALARVREGALQYAVAQREAAAADDEHGKVMAGTISAHSGAAAASETQYKALLALIGLTEDDVAAEQRKQEATDGTTGAMAATTAQTEEATKALEEWIGELQKIGESFVEPLSTYQEMLEAKKQSERESAEATAAATQDSSDSWRDYVGDVTVSLDEYATKLEEQLTAQDNWRTNIVTITQRGGLEVGQAIAAMGEDGVQLAAQMATGTDAEFQRMAALIVEDTRRGGADAATELDSAMKVMAAVGAAGASATVQGIAYQLGIGADTVRGIAASYGVNLAEGINPLLVAVGRPRVIPVINGQRQPGFWDGGFTGPGGKYEAAGVVHKGEVVWSQDDVAAHGGPDRVDSLRQSRMPGYANGGFVTAADVPKPYSTAPYGVPISTAGDAAMQKGFDEVTAWLTANAGTAGNGAVGGDWQSIWNWVKARIPQATQNSTYRAGDPGYHGKGKAVDFGFGGVPGGNGSAGLALINRTLHDGLGANLAELIYDGIGDDRPDLKNGKPLTYSAATRAEHHNHVHAATYDQGGPLYPGYTLAYNGTGSTEWVSKSPAEMPGYGSAGGGSFGGIDYGRLAAALSGLKSTHIAVDATGFNADLIARKVADRQREEAFLSG